MIIAKIAAPFAAVALGFLSAALGNVAHAQQPDPQQQMAAQSVVIQYLQREADAKVLRIAILSQQIEALQKQIEDAKPKPKEQTK